MDDTGYTNNMSRLRKGNEAGYEHRFRIQSREQFSERILCLRVFPRKLK